VTDHSPPTTAEIKNEELLPLPPGACMAVAGQFYFTLTFTLYKLNYLYPSYLRTEGVTCVAWSGIFVPLIPRLEVTGEYGEVA
jgi:hypothetical protein